MKVFLSSRCAVLQSWQLERPCGHCLSPYAVSIGLPRVQFLRAVSACCRNDASIPSSWSAARRLAGQEAPIWSSPPRTKNNSSDGCTFVCMAVRVQDEIVKTLHKPLTGLRLPSPFSVADSPSAGAGAGAGSRGIQQAKRLLNAPPLSAGSLCQRLPLVTRLRSLPALGGESLKLAKQLAQSQPCISPCQIGRTHQPGEPRSHPTSPPVRGISILKVGFSTTTLPAPIASSTARGNTCRNSVGYVVQRACLGPRPSEEACLWRKAIGGLAPLHPAGTFRR